MKEPFNFFSVSFHTALTLSLYYNSLDTFRGHFSSLLTEDAYIVASFQKISLPAMGMEWNGVA